MLQEKRNLDKAQDVWSMNKRVKLLDKVDWAAVVVAVMAIIMIVVVILDKL